MLLNQILQYTPDQINALPEDKRQQVLQLVQIARQRGMVRRFLECRVAAIMIALLLRFSCLVDCTSEPRLVACPVNSSEGSSSVCAAGGGGGGFCFVSGRVAAGGRPSGAGSAGRGQRRSAVDWSGALLQQTTS